MTGRGTSPIAGAALDQTLAALADPVRRRTIELLHAKPRRAGDLARELRVSPSRMSQHLRVLRRCGVIEDDGLEHDARVKLYRLKPQPFSGLRSWLDEVERFWTLELAAFKTHAERRGSRGDRVASDRGETVQFGSTRRLGKRTGGHGGRDR
jgi:DNA-binding transcriptional ArsR family regulator